MKNLTTIFTFFVALAIFSSCVSKKKYEEALAAAAAEKSALESELASAQEESAKLQEQSNKLQQDFNMSQEEISKLGETVKEKNTQISSLQDAIKDAFDTYNSSDVNVTSRNGKLYITMANSILFRSGRAVVDTDGKGVVATLADVIKGNPDLNISVEGHTDNEPVKIHKKHVDNWGLSSARALAIVRELEKMGINGDRLTALGKGETEPIASNDSEDGREKNRRTEFVIDPDLSGLIEIYQEDLASSGSN